VKGPKHILNITLDHKANKQAITYKVEVLYKQYIIELMTLHQMPQERLCYQIHRKEYLFVADVDLHS
jgi:hypothetical protein